VLVGRGRWETTWSGIRWPESMLLVWHGRAERAMPPPISACSLPFETFGNSLSRRWGRSPSLAVADGGHGFAGRKGRVEEIACTGALLLGWRLLRTPSCVTVSLREDSNRGRTCVVDL
jgi:hypothetical protein